jgi:hypothetical protein
LKKIYSLIVEGLTSRPRFVLTGLITIVTLAHGIYAKFTGPKSCPDCHWYAIYADKLIADNFDIGIFISHADSSIPVHFYLTWIFTLALIKLLFGFAWQSGALYFNIFVNLMIITTAVLTVYRASQASLISAMATGLLLLVAIEHMLWIPFPLTDISYEAIFLCSLTLLYYALTSASTRLRLGFGSGVFFFVFVAMFSRPTSAALVMAVLCSCILIVTINFNNPEDRLCRLRVITGTLVSVALVGIFLHALLLAQQTSADATGYLSQLTSLYSKGVVVIGRPETFLTPPEGSLGYFLISLRKLVYFFWISLDAFSVVHSVGNWIFFFPAYLSCAVILRDLFSMYPRLGKNEQVLALICIIFLVSTAVFHSVMMLDYDWRYRLPCIPIFAIIFGLGARLTIISRSE